MMKGAALIDRSIGPVRFTRAGAVWFVQAYGRELACGIGRNPRFWRLLSLRPVDVGADAALR